MKFKIIHGPNMNLLGIREPDIYGHQTYEDLELYITDFCRDLHIDCDFFQSNHEGDLIDEVHRAMGDCDGLILNPAAYSHTSIALADALRAVNLPAIEVHISDISRREDFRHHTVTGEACIEVIAGEGFAGYTHAVTDLADYLNKKKETAAHAH